MWLHHGTEDVRALFQICEGLGCCTAEGFVLLLQAGERFLLLRERKRELADPLVPRSQVLRCGNLFGGGSLLFLPAALPGGDDLPGQGIYLAQELPF